jgi:hypothetical protein
MTCSMANFTYWVRIAIEAADFCPMQNVQAGSGLHPATFRWAPGIFPGGKAAEA